MNLIHRGLANTVTLFMLIMGLWALVHYFRNRALDGNFWGIVAIGEILIFVQVALGTLLLLQGFGAPRPALHYLYGGFALLVLPAIYYYTQGEQDRRAALIWCFTGIFMFGLSLRFIGMGTLGY